ncbi:MAG TPA: DUF434 domain-containing protein [Phycisphaerae bacterium]|nr:DUF434 domain-containing protein [Phycisphaerae bacterium]
MPDKRRHRGPHPEDAVAFSPRNQPTLRTAVAELSWLLSRGYAEKSTIKLVGDHYSLTERQRMAMMRCACSDVALARRTAHEMNAEAIRGRPLALDGYNVLTTIEASLAGGIILQGRDGCYRDLASMHGSFRKVEETGPAIELVGMQIADLHVPSCVWYLDRPVSNSGRLKTLIAQTAEQHQWDWSVELVPSPDKVLIESPQVAATADSVILDRCERWFNLSRVVVQSKLPRTHIVCLG